ncbi:MAG: glycosyltransferase family 2 protein [Alistipes sp.]|nr:glycosyltransferase family 2 protein [Alistipes sp.]
MEISVIVPTYKPQAYFFECLESLKAQNLLKECFEVIIVLNGVKEPYFSNIKMYIDGNMSSYNISLLYTDVSGVSNARNLGIENAIGKYVTFIDDDDYISPAYLERMYAKAEMNTVVLCYPYFFNDGEPGIQLKYKMTEIYDKQNDTPCRINSSVRSFFSGPCMKLIPMHFIAGIRFDTRLRNGEDTLFMFAISYNIDRIVFSDRNAIYYRRNRLGSAVNTKRSLKDIYKSNLIQVIEYTRYFLHKPFKYNWLFYCTRIAGALNAIIRSKRNCK